MWPITDISVDFEHNDQSVNQYSQFKTPLFSAEFCTLADYNKEQLDQSIVFFLFIYLFIHVCIC